MEDYISGEEHQKRQAAQKVQQPKKQLPWLWIGVAAVLVMLGFGIFKLVAPKTPTPAAANGPGAPTSLGSGPTNCGSGMCTNSATCTQQSNGTCTTQSVGNGPTPTPGTVTAVSSDSITIKVLPDGTSTKTFAITSSTKESKGQNSADVAFNASDIHVGDTVAILPASNGTDASSVLLNPDFHSQSQ